MPTGIKSYRELFLDFEFYVRDGENPEPICLVVIDGDTGEEFRWDMGQLARLDAFPLNVDHRTLLIAYYMPAEVACMLSLGWQVPPNLLDLYVEFRNETNGLRVLSGVSLLGALVHYGIQSITAEQKLDMRQLAMRGPPYTSVEMHALLDYCATDVVALVSLMDSMRDCIDMDRALLRGQYAIPVAHMERNGIPLDCETLYILAENVDSLRAYLIDRINDRYGVYVGGSFKIELFAKYLYENEISWPRTSTGRLRLDDATFKAMAACHPILNPLRELRSTLGALPKVRLTVGKDGRNRCLLSPFQSRTGRNQPSTTKHIFGSATWWRCLIRAPEGHSIAYVDYSQQEFGIAAALSADPKMKCAYHTGDPYLAFAIQAGAAPIDATKQTHKKERDQFKATTLAVQYGMGAESLAERLAQPLSRARDLLRLHRETYPTFWRWSDAALDFAMFHGYLHSSFGWKVHVPRHPNPRSLRNFPMQANGAEMLRIACCDLIRAGIKVCTPVHDAVLIEARTEDIEQVVALTQKIMGDASEKILPGFRLTTDAEIYSYPDRYMDPRGEDMWDTVQQFLTRVGCNVGD